MTLPTPAPDRTALVTGTSSGIGADIARELVRRGHGVTLVARRADKLAELAAELGDATRVEVIAADLADADARESLVDEIAGRGLTVDVLVNNAGLSTVGPVAGATPAAELNMLRVNVEAVVDLTTRLVPGMVERHRGAVLNVASTAAFQPIPGQAGYAATKAFVLSYTEALRTELQSHGVTVTALCPGPVRTGFVAATGLSEEDFEGSLPNFMFVSAADVAKAAVEGLAAGRGVVIPGAANQVGARLAALTPRRVLLPLLARRHPGLR
jgi:short-subunit dehydrogenase